MTLYRMDLTFMDVCVLGGVGGDKLNQSPQILRDALQTDHIHCYLPRPPRDKHPSLVFELPTSPLNSRTSLPSHTLSFL